MARELPAAIEIELKSIFLRELDENHTRALEAHRRLRDDPTDRQSLEILRRHFHRVAGAAGSCGFEVLGHLAAACEDVAELTLTEGPGAIPVAQALEILRQGMRGITSVLAADAPDPTSTLVLSSQALGLEHHLSDRPQEKVLVVEDDPYSARLIDDCLKGAGFKSAWCSQPEQALKMIECEVPDLIILDVVMPGLDGFELCRRIRSLAALQLTPIIFVTRHGDVEQRVRGLEMGGNDYISKPFNPQELIARVRSLLHRLSTLKDMAIHDGLTRTYNHKYFKLRLEQEVARTRRYGGELSVAMLDIDFFKKINDLHGHPTGDAVLMHLANLVSASLRTTDVVARYGGEEFAIILLHAGLTESSVVVQRLCQRIASWPFPRAPGIEGSALSVTASIGVAQLAGGDDPARLLARADEALYEAKANGRNQVRCAQTG